MKTEQVLFKGTQQTGMYTADSFQLLMKSAARTPSVAIPLPVMYVTDCSNRRKALTHEQFNAEFIV